MTDELPPDHPELLPGPATTRALQDISPDVFVQVALWRLFTYAPTHLDTEAIRRIGHAVTEDAKTKTEAQS